MQQLFLVGGKLLGIYFLVTSLTQAVFLLTGGSRFAGSNITLIVPLLTVLIAGVVLTFFTRPVLKLVGLRDFDPAPPRISPRSALEVGCILLGLLEFVQCIPRFVTRWDEYRDVARGTLSPLGIADAILLAISLGLVFAARPIAGFLMAANRRPPRAIDAAQEPSAP
jgi:hypothetical protein